MGRPVQKFHDFIGQKKIVDQLRRLMAGAMQLKEPFPHTVFVGPSGVGKTMLAKALAAEYGTTCYACYGDMTAHELVRECLQLKHHDFLFVDEAHGFNRYCQELLDRVIDDHVVPKPEDSDRNSVENGPETTEYVSSCTIILATDQPGCLEKAMRRRLAHEVRLNFYSTIELTEIVAKICAEANILISPQAAKMIASRSRGVPGTAKALIRMIRMWYPDAEKTQLTKSDIDEYCAEYEIDAAGLTTRDHDYMSFLRQVKCASLESLALKLGTDEVEVRRFIEPYLMRLGLVQIAKGGRCLTDLGRKQIENLPLEKRTSE